MRFCARPGCSATVPRGFCAAHARDRDSRPDATRRGYDAQWRELSRRKREADPFCEIRTHCNHPTLATEVDHIQPVALRPDLRLAWGNLQSACHRCHVAKTNEERA